VPSETYPKLYKLAATNGDVEGIMNKFSRQVILNYTIIYVVFACAVNDMAF